MILPVWSLNLDTSSCAPKSLTLIKNASLNSDMLVQSVIIVQSIASCPRNFSPDVNSIRRHFSIPFLVSVVRHSSATYGGAVTKWAQIFRRIELAERAVAAFSIGGSPPTLGRYVAVRIWWSFNQGLLKDTSGCYCEKRSKTWNARANDSHARFQCAPYTRIDVAP